MKFITINKKSCFVERKLVEQIDIANFIKNKINDLEIEDFKCYVDAPIEGVVYVDISKELNEEDVKNVMEKIAEELQYELFSNRDYEKNSYILISNRENYVRHVLNIYELPKDRAIVVSQYKYLAEYSYNSKKCVVFVMIKEPSEEEKKNFYAAIQDFDDIDLDIPIVVDEYEDCIVASFWNFTKQEE